MVQYIRTDRPELIKVLYSGIIAKEDILQYIKLIDEDESLPEMLLILGDARKAEFNFDTASLDSFAEAVNKSIKKFKKVREAFIQSTPFGTALSILYNQLQKDSRYESAVFTTEKAAMEWLINSEII